MKKKIAKKIKNLFYRPFYMFVICLIFLVFNLLIDGTLFQIFHLGRDLKVIQNRTEDLQEKNKIIKRKILRSSDPDFIEEEARERLDFSEEGDLIFIFPESI